MYKKLEEIIKNTTQDLLEKKKENKRFQQATQNPREGKIAIIAEIKLASPSAGNLGNINEIEFRIKEYERAGVDAISVVTERRFFKGDPKMVTTIRGMTALPILQKDFVIDEYQLYEAKNLGADAILLIVRIIPEKDLIKFVNLAKKIGIEPVVEVNSKNDLKGALKTDTKVIAVNARDLDTFEVDVDKACDLIKRIPSRFIRLAFSGVKGREEMKRYGNAGVDGVLIGTSLMKSRNISNFLKGVRV